MSIWYPTDLGSVLRSIHAAIVATGVYGPTSLVYVADPNNHETWPVISPPFATMSIGGQDETGEPVGGGRWVKSWTSGLTFNLVFTNILDQPYVDAVAETSEDPALGIYARAQLFIDAVEQCYPTDDAGLLTLRELPIATLIDEPYRYGKSYEYLVLPIVFEISWVQAMTGAFPVP